ncbi:hypothetical protein ACFLZZ_02355 [Nanoarchaeota archaeon]
MSLEGQIYAREYKIGDIHHENLNDLIIMDRSNLEFPDYSLDELSKEADYLKRDLSQLHSSQKGGSRIHLGIGGGIGAGKTTITRSVQRWIQGARLEERTDGPGLNCLYSKGGKPIFGFPYQFIVGGDRGKIMSMMDGLTLSAVIDRPWEEDYLFSLNFNRMIVDKENNIKALSDNQFKYVSKYITRKVAEHSPLNIRIELQASDEVLTNRINERNRKIEIEGAIKKLSDEEVHDMIIMKEKYMVDAIKEHAPTELEEFKSKLVGYDTPNEIEFEGSPPKYIIGLNSVYPEYPKVLSEVFHDKGILLRLNVDPKNGIDVRENIRGHIPIMKALKEAAIFHLLRNHYRVFEKRNNKGLKIIPPWEVIY